jgi:hypothetical protein
MITLLVEVIAYCFRTTSCSPPCGNIATSNNSVVQGYTGLHATIPVPLKRSEVSSEDLFVILIGANDAFFKHTIDGVVPAISDIIYTLQKKGEL